MLGRLSFFALSRPFLHALFYLILLSRLVAATSLTVAIDDTYGDAMTGAMPAYGPSTAWTQGQPCNSGDSECLVDPDPKQAHNGTWHVSSNSNLEAPPRTIDLSFEGTPLFYCVANRDAHPGIKGDSINVYCIISEDNRTQIAVANMTFELDGQQVGNFFHEPSGAMDGAGNYAIQYNVAVYQSHPITQGKHTLRISLIGYSSVYFDYALYTYVSSDHCPRFMMTKLWNSFGSQD